MKKNKLIIIICVLVFIVLLSLFSPFNSEKLKGNVNFESFGFKDKNLYDCVTLSYVMTKSEASEGDIDKLFDRYQNTINFIMTDISGYDLLGNLSYELKDEDLKNITELTCNNVKDTTGIEKLTGLEEIKITGSFNTLDLSNASNIKNIDVKSSKLENFLVSKDSKIEELNIHSSSIKNIDLKDVYSIYEMELETQNLESFVPPKKIERSFSLDSKKITVLDLSNAESISRPSLNTPNLTDLNFGKALIYNLWISRANLEKIDLTNVNHYYVYDRVKEVKTNKDNYIVYTYNTRKLEFADGSFINLISDKLGLEYYGGKYLLLKDADISTDEIKTGIEISGLEIKICATKTICDQEITSMLQLDGAYLVVYQNNSIIGEFEIAYFDNDIFDDFKIYSQVIDNYNLNKKTSYTTKTNLTEEQLKEVTSISGYKDHIIHSTKGLEKLINLKSLHVEGNINIDDIKNLKSINSINLKNSNLEKLDLSVFENLEYLEISNSYIDEINIDNKKLIDTEMYSNYIGKLDLFKTVKKDNSLIGLELRNCDLTNIDFSNLVNLEEFNISYNDIEEIDFSNIKDDVYGEIENVPFKKINGLDINYYQANNALEEVYLGECNKIETLQLISQNLRKLDMGNCPTLKNLMILGNSLKSIENIENATNLENLILIFEDIEELDLSALNKLQVLYIGNAPATRNTINMLANTNKEHVMKVKFPSHFNLIKYNEDDYVANYDEETNMIIANNPGQTVITSTILTIDALFTSEETYQMFKTTVNVYDITSNKFLINKEYKYIFNENNEANKVLNRYIKVYGEDVSKEIDGNKLYMYSGDKKIFTFDILEFTSEEYKIDNTKNIITYSGTFDINKLNVVNGSLNKIDDEIQLICNDSIVKTYKLEKK